MPVQKFQLGDRVKPKEDLFFVIQDIRMRHGQIEYSGHWRPWYAADYLTLMPERPPYVPSDRLVLGRSVTITWLTPELYRCETDAERAARHAIERAARHAIERAARHAQGDRV